MSVRKTLSKNVWLSNVYQYIKTKRFKGSAKFWEERYLSGGNSGSGSFGILAEYKAAFLNMFVSEHHIRSVIEFGCGDGNQLLKAAYPEYVGLDISNTAINKCVELFKGDPLKRFFLYHTRLFENNKDLLIAELALSLDVIYHLTEEGPYQDYMHRLFDHSSLYVIIYAWDVDLKQKIHVKHRKFTTWVKKYKSNWTLVDHVHENRPDAACDFFVYQKNKD